MSTAIFSDMECREARLVTHAICKWFVGPYHNILQVTTLTVRRMNDTKWLDLEGEMIENPYL